MSESSPVNIAELIDRCPLGRMQIRIIVLCGLVALLEGFDVLAIGVAAPAMAGSLHLAPNQLGAVFSAAVLGLMLGAFALGPMADRFGRKWVLVGSTATFGVLTLCTAGVVALQQILLLRFLAGLGMGGVVPSFISLVAEYTPSSRRQAVLGLLWAGFPLGGVVVGLVASRAIDAFGWQSLFYIGGILPLSLSMVLIWALPDSIQFLVMRGAAWQEIRNLLIRIDPTVNLQAGYQSLTDDAKKPGVPLWELFSASRAGGTVLLWVSYFITFMILVSSSAWVPTLLQRAGTSGAQSSLAMALFAFGGVFGTSLAGFVMSRFARVLPAALVCSAVTLAGVGYVSQPIVLAIMLLGLAGFFLGLASSGLIALAPLLYSTAIRSTGVGWAMGVGRLGSFIGPLVIGSLVSRGWRVADSFTVIGAPALCAALFTSLIQISPRKPTGPAPLMEKAGTNGGESLHQTGR
ncbi:MAG: MFS transporter [Verrucomicrobia bacterium]|nr:MFS transporter [Verrucomicrobiota bacterium]MBV8274298.1 MFS transporter [Verrucomicrobiota bacterium]